jgi:hypothetical protein
MQFTKWVTWSEPLTIYPRSWQHLPRRFNCTPPPFYLNNHRKVYHLPQTSSWSSPEGLGIHYCPSPYWSPLWQVYRQAEKRLHSRYSCHPPCLFELREEGIRIYTSDIRTEDSINGMYFNFKLNTLYFRKDLVNFAESIQIFNCALLSIQCHTKTRSSELSSIQRLPSLPEALT